MKIVVAGANGLIGRHLVARLRERGDEAVALVRRPGSAAERGWDGRSLDSSVVDGANAVVNLAGASVAGQRWTGSYKIQIRQSRIESTRAIVEAIRASRSRPKVLVNASAVGWYGGRGDEEITETSAPGKDFLAEVCQAWEAEALRAEPLGVRVVLLRTGVVLARDGGALAKMVPPFKAFVGGPIGSGRQWVPWIHLADEVGLILWAIDSQVRGPVVAVAPNAVRMKDFARALGRALRRPAIFPVPAPALRLAMGEMAEVLLEGQRARPVKALEGGYRFRFGEVGAALADLFPRR
jgi:uncharacterized protein (TIGR01777 family)